MSPSLGGIWAKETGDLLSCFQNLRDAVKLEFPPVKIVLCSEIERVSPLVLDDDLPVDIASHGNPDIT